MLHSADRGASASARFLLIDQDCDAARALSAELDGALSTALDSTIAPCGREGADWLKAQPFDVVVIDLDSLSDMAARSDESVGRLARLAEGALIIALSSESSVSAAVATMRAGAHDFIAKPVNGQAFASRIGELAQRHGKARNLGLQPAITNGPRDYAGFVGGSSQMQFVYEQIARIAASSAPVFITGESGTGKDVCAEALHSQGPRAGEKFVAINCAAIPRDLMESELFGAARGSYTGAHEDRKGAVELAHNGTLFLDEIGEMDLSLQSKLLRFLQTGTVTRVGDAVARKVDVRVVCATNRNPMQLITERKFREDLFYRLHVLPIHLPPLRQRPADIMVLARYFLDKFSAEEHKVFTGFAGETAHALLAREWPGNVRQLQNIIRRIVVMFDGGVVSPDMIHAADIESRGVPNGLPAIEPMRSRHKILPMWRQEQQIIEDAIQSFGGNIALAAAALEISPSTIYRKRQSWAEMDAGKGAA